MYTVVKTKNENVSIKLTWTPRPGKETWIRGYPIDSNKGIRLDGYGEVKRKADSVKDIEIVKDYVINAILEKMTPQRSEKRDGSSYKDLDTSSSIVQTFIELIEKKVRIREWADSTQKAATAYFLKNTLPEIQHVVNEEDFTDSSREELKEKMMVYSLSNERSQKRLENADAGAETHLYEASVIYAAMQERNPSLPDITFVKEGKKSRIQTEQIKSLIISIHRKVRKEIEMIVEDDPMMARGAALMDGGLRPAEAAAVQGKSFFKIGNNLGVEVICQEQDGKRMSRLKSDSGYRKVVLDEWCSSVITRCNELIEERKLEFEEFTTIRGTEISKWVKGALKRSGCDDNYIKEAMQILKDHPEYDDKGFPESDVAAYILRRNRASIWKNFCGFTQEEIDYLLGHKKIKKGRRSFNVQDRELLRTWALKNSRYDIFPEISDNPANKSVGLKNGTKMDIDPFHSMKFTNVSLFPIKVTLNIVTTEAGEAVVIRTNGEIGDKSRYTSKRIKKRKMAEIIGFIPESERGDFDEE